MVLTFQTAWFRSRNNVVAESETCFECLGYLQSDSQNIVHWLTCFSAEGSFVLAWCWQCVCVYSWRTGSIVRLSARRIFSSYKVRTNHCMFPPFQFCTFSVYSVLDEMRMLFFTVTDLHLLVSILFVWQTSFCIITTHSQKQKSICRNQLKIVKAKWIIMQSIAYPFKIIHRNCNIITVSVRHFTAQWRRIFYWLWSRKPPPPHLSWTPKVYLLVLKRSRPWTTAKVSSVHFTHFFSMHINIIAKSVLWLTHGLDDRNSISVRAGFYCSTQPAVVEWHI
jgi:hypothetical protein